MRHIERPGIPASEPAARRWARDLWQDLGYALRQLRHAPGVSALIVATLAIGIGANATMAGAVDRLLLRAPAGVRDADGLVRLLFQEPGAPVLGGYMNYPALMDLRREVGAFADVAGYTSQALPFGVGPDAPEIRATLVSPSFFSLLGARPVLGRLFTSADGFPEGAAAGGPALAVLGHGFWQRQFGGDPRVLGRTVRLGTLTYTVIGVTQPGFAGVEAEVPDVWLPVTVTAAVELTPRQAWLEDRGSAWMLAVARMRPGATRAAAEAQGTTVWRHYNTTPGAPGADTRLLTTSVIRGRGPDRPREVKVALWLGGVSALVLLIACANVANLLLARAFTRRREIAVRLALGAGRGRLARQMLAEAGLLAMLGGVGAVGLAALGGGVLRRLFVSAGLGAGGFVDARLLAFSAAIALGTGMLVSLAPLAQSTTPDLTAGLRAGQASGGGRTSRVRAALLGAQAALCMLLLVVAALFAQSLHRVQSLDLGLDPEQTLSASFNLDRGAMTVAERDAGYAEMLERVRAIPGVTGAARATGGGRAVAVHTKTHDTWEHTLRTQGVPYEAAVDSGYFRMLGTSMRGRDFTAADVRGAPLVTILNEPLAELLFPGQDAIGQCVYLPIRSNDPDGDCWTVVGVVQGFWYHRSILNREGLLVYVPLAQRSYGLGRPGRLVVSVNGPTAAVIPAVRQAILDAWPGLDRVRVQAMRDTMTPELRPWQLAATMFSLFGAVALVIAAVGLYAVVAFAAAQRSTEIAVRIALGAHARNVLAVVAGDGLRTVVVGLAVGAAAALGIRHWLGPLLFQTSPGDPRIIGGVAALLLGVAALAVAVPTVRALRRDPAAVLRVD
jgi:predicted permease